MHEAYLPSLLKICIGSISGVVIIYVLRYLKAKPRSMTETCDNEVPVDKNNNNLDEKRKHPISVNYHFSRKCNYECGFCFHTAKTSHVLKLEEIKKGLRKLKGAGMRKINFAGGEPFLYPKLLGNMVRYCKEDLNMDSVSIISNGSLIKEDWMEKYSKYIDILGISCDSFAEEVNIKIGRGKGKHIENLLKVRDLCRQYNIKFKLNTVVCKYNYDEDMNECISKLEPFRWKCFQVLIVKTENDGQRDSIRNANSFIISDEQFQKFCDRHKNQPSFIMEPNNVMRSSYLILDEYMRFLDKGDENIYIASESILDVDVHTAFGQIKWDNDSFNERNGEYNWSRDELSFESSDCSIDKSLEW